MDESETVLAGRYRLEAVVGSSETGPIWQAQDEALMRRVAIKEVLVPPDVPPSVKAAIRDRLLATASLTLQLRHPGIVPTYDVFFEGARCYAVSALAEGSSLADDLEPLLSPPRLRRALLSAIGVVAALLALVIIATQAVNWNPFADAQTSTERQSPPVNDRARRPLPDPFQSRALYRFSRNLFQPDECRRPEAGEFAAFEEIPDTEAVFCEADGYQLRLFRKVDANGLRDERRLYMDGAIEGSVQRINAAPTGPAGLFDGRRFVFRHASDDQARVYWDSLRCACGGVIAGSDEPRTIIDVWLGG